MSYTPPAPTDAAAWDKARLAFAKSMLVDTALASLAQDLDVPPWPVASPDETPAVYIYLPYSQAVAALAERGLPPSQLGALITILTETSAFDEPFADMMDISAAPDPGVLDAESPLAKNLAKLELPADYPLAWSALDEGTIDLCRGEKVDTLGQFVAFASRLSQSVIVGGDFRALLNALAQRDEAGLARLLPFRPGAKGLHLAEALALEAARLTPALRAQVCADPLAAPADARARVSRLVSWFAAEHDALRAASDQGRVPALQLVAGLPDSTLAPVVAALLTPHLPAPPAPPPPPRGFWQKLFGRA